MSVIQRTRIERYVLDLTCVNKNKHTVVYPDVPSAIKPQPHGPGVPVPSPPKNTELQDNIEDIEVDDTDTSVTYQTTSTMTLPRPLTQGQLNDLTRDLGLSKENAQLLASRLSESNLLSQETTYFWFRNRDEEFRKFFAVDSCSSLMYCNDVKGLIEALGVPYQPSEWRLFIDSSSRSLKAVLLNIGNKMASVPIGHSVQLTESYKNMKVLINTIKYSNHNWLICGDLKVVCLLLGMQGGYTKYPCFMCLWDSRADSLHYKQKDWPSREAFQIGCHNVVAQPLVPPKNVLLPPLHIKLGLMKNFVKALNKEGQAFKYLLQKFPQISDAKLHAGIFDGLQIRTLLKDKHFYTNMEASEQEAWRAFSKVIDGFLGNKRSSEYISHVNELMKSFEKLGARMSIKMHFLQSHLDYFPANCGDYSE
ncbi:uncharacterized protein LOC143024134 [Oratosquilla oratoria]|uniref:uncharacterized protein LOC143024134 n=1 Tax=Oratosquilla oratoria TaxID=337810 RepID=UPI003F7590EF